MPPARTLFSRAMDARVFALLLGAAHAACPGAAAPGYYCAGAVETQCPVGAWCAGGASANAPCYPATACVVAGLSSQPPCYWNVSTLAGNGTAGFADGAGGAMFNGPRRAVFNGSSLLVSEFQNGRVRKVDIATGSTTTLWSSSVLGGVAIDGSRALFVLSPTNVSFSSNGGAFISTKCAVGTHADGISFINASFGFWFTKCVFFRAGIPEETPVNQPPPTFSLFKQLPFRKADDALRQQLRGCCRQ